MGLTPVCLLPYGCLVSVVRRVSRRRNSPWSSPVKADRQSGTFLLGIDLEDVRHHMHDGRRYRARAGMMTEQFLRFFGERNIKATFFTVGSVAREYASLVRDIHADGHEIACHTDTHAPLTQHTPASFTYEMLQCAEQFRASRHRSH